MTGPVTVNMERALKDVHKQTPNPKLVIALGDCAINCGVFMGSCAVTGPVDRHICPSKPAEILRVFQELRSAHKTD